MNDLDDKGDNLPNSTASEYISVYDLLEWARPCYTDYIETAEDLKRLLKNKPFPIYRHYTGLKNRIEKNERELSLEFYLKWIVVSKNFDSTDLKKLLLNKKEIEHALGLPVLVKTKPNQEPPTPNDTTALKAEIDRLKQENAELLKALQQADETPKSAVDYQAFSIHGHTSENLEILFKIAKVIAEKCDPDNPHSYPLKSDYSEYVKRYYSDSEKLIEALFQILTPNKVKHKGRPPKGVDTFQGFIDKP